MHIALLKGAVKIYAFIMAKKSAHRKYKGQQQRSEE
jgi:hypothetical protein